MLRLHSTSFRGVFRIHSDIYDGVLCEKLLTIFTKKLIADVRLGSKYAPKLVCSDVRVVAPETI